MKAAGHRRLQALAALLALAAVVAALAARRTLHAPVLERVAAVEQALEARLTAPARPRPELLEDPAEFERLLSLAPGTRRVDALPFYEEEERAAFARARWRTASPEDTPAALAPPAAVTALYSAGAVALSWELSPSTRAFAGELPAKHRLGVRIYRAEGGAEPELLATVPLETTRYRDAAMPLLGTTLGYRLWTVLLAGEEQALVSAAPSDMVTVPVPDHFRLVLLGGNRERARFRVELGPEAAPLAAETLELQPGDPVMLGERPTGLVLDGLSIRSEERMQDRERLVFGPGGSLVLDARTGEPRTTTSQVLVPVERLIATLRGPDGRTSRTLETDLP